MKPSRCLNINKITKKSVKCPKINKDKRKQTILINFFFHIYLFNPVSCKLTYNGFLLPAVGEKYALNLDYSLKSINTRQILVFAQNPNCWKQKLAVAVVIY